METRHDPSLGVLTYDPGEGAYVSEVRPLAVLGGHPCRFIIECFPDPRPDEVHAAIRNMIEAGPSVLTAAEEFVVQYCTEMLELELEANDPDQPRSMPKLAKPEDVWKHVQFGDEIYVSRRSDGDPEDGIYLSLECNCDWEVEHGLQLVFREGRAVTKVGSFDGHVTNTDACSDAGVRGVIYRSLRS
jgi:hypothetical protein